MQKKRKKNGGKVLETLPVRTNRRYNWEFLPAPRGVTAQERHSRFIKKFT